MRSIAPPTAQSQPEVDEYSSICHSPEALALVARIEEKASRRTLRYSKSRKKPPTPWLPGGQGVAPEPPLLVINDISRREPSPAPLPPWSYVPTSPTTWYLVFHQDVYVCRSQQDVPPPAVDRGTKSQIFEFSDRSRANLRHVCCNAGHLVKSQFGLTYHETWPTDGRQVKRHLQAWLKYLNRLCPQVGNLWVLEFQKRGAPHYHVFLTIPPDRVLQVQLADAWTRITGGTETQTQFHAHHSNWKPWKMADSKYVEKYVDKKDQKEVPEQFHNVGRFWGHSRHFQPFGMVVEPASVCRFAAPGVARWEEESLTRFINRALRRYHEKCMNYDSKTGERRKQKRKKATLLRGRSEIPGHYRVPGGSKLVVQIMDYVAEHGPDLGTFKRQLREKVPF